MADPAKLTIVSPVKDTEFAITTDPVMPDIAAEVKIDGATPDPTASTSFDWTANISFEASSCPHGKARTITHPEVKESVVGGKWKPKFTQIRGGTLTLTVAAAVGDQKLTASVTAKIAGTNPSKAEVQAAFPDKTIRMIASQESGLRQFRTKPGETKSECPLWSGDNLGGAGMMQITNPAPTDDQVWSWKANLEKGTKILAEKRAVAKGYANQVRNSTGFKKLVDAFNAARKTASQPELTITVPDYTDEQLQHDTIRGYNGFAGKDAFGFPLHEYRIKLDAAGNLVVTDKGGNNGTVEWEEVPVADRPSSSGDPNYVQNVLKQSV